MTDYRPLIEKDVKELAKSICSVRLKPDTLAFSLYVNPDGSIAPNYSQISPVIQAKPHMVNLLAAGYTGSCVVKVIRDGYGLENEAGHLRIGYMDNSIETYGFEVTVYNPNFYAALPHPYIAPNQLGTFEVGGGPQEYIRRKYEANHYYFPHVVKTLLNVDGIENLTQFSVNF